MPQLNWDETEFLECLEVIPRVEDYEVEHVYRVERDGHILALTVWQHESAVQFSLREREVEAPLVEFVLFVREGVRLVGDKRGRYLEFQECIVAPSRFSYIEMGDVFDTERFNSGLLIHLAVHPHLQIRHVRRGR